MQPSARDVQDFYKTAQGQAVRRAIRRAVTRIWSDSSFKGLRLIGLGYSLPYLSAWQGQAEFSGHVVPPSCLPLSAEEINSICVSELESLPFETNSVDRLVIIHGLEFTDQFDSFWSEIFRVMKSTGRVIVVVPNRMGLWARAERTPFGHGIPFSATQIENMLCAHGFVHERTDHALFFPPLARRFCLRFANVFERVGRVCCAGLGGVHIIELSKRIYAGTAVGVEERTKSIKPIKTPAGVSGRSHP